LSTLKKGTYTTSVCVENARLLNSLFDTFAATARQYEACLHMLEEINVFSSVLPHVSEILLVWAAHSCAPVICAPVICEPTYEGKPSG